MTDYERLLLSEVAAIRQEVAAVRDDVAELRVQVAHLEAASPPQRSGLRDGGLVVSASTLGGAVLWLMQALLK